MKGDRWTKIREAASRSFDRYVRRMSCYGRRERQTAEAAFHSGFRSGYIAGKRGDRPPRGSYLTDCDMLS
jgi:hypothetical protein